MIEFNKITFLKRKEEVVFYPYRTASVRPLLKITEEEDIIKIKKELCALVGVEPDNHIVFECGGIALMFTDGNLIIGDEVIKRRW